MSPDASDNPEQLAARLFDARRELLDLTTRNRLLSTPRHRKRSSSIEIVDERSDQVFDILVRQQKRMTFLPGDEPAEPAARDADAEQVSPADDQEAVEGERDLTRSGIREPREDSGGPDAASADPATAESPISEPAASDILLEGSLQQPEDDQPGEKEVAERHADRRLQTDLPSQKLQSRLLRQFYDARTFEEEQGVNILYLALGFLKWRDRADTDRDRYAPLLLLPVRIDRRSARSRFSVAWTGEDLATNLSLKVKLKADFGIDLPDLPSDPEDMDTAAYFQQVRVEVAGITQWAVLEDDIVLWFFSFSRLLMYLDLDPGHWPKDSPLLARPLLHDLLEGRFTSGPPVLAEDESVDDLLDPLETRHVLDADSSQSLAIEEARRGRNLVIQGPPGTGKSQTIANLIAAAVFEGRTVLFLAEKAAALNVVKRRLDHIGLGSMCLPLHSYSASKRAVLEELGATMSLARPKLDNVEQTAEQLKRIRDQLNAHCEMMHARDGTSGLTPFLVIGELVRLRDADVPPADFQFDSAELWTGDDLRARRHQLEELAAFIRALGSPPACHPWRGVMLDSSLPTDRQRLAALLPSIIEHVQMLLDAGDALADTLDRPSLERVGDLRVAIDHARQMLTAPALDGKALGDEVWAQSRTDIGDLIESGLIYSRSRETLRTIVTEAAWEVDLSGARRDLAGWGQSWLRFFIPAYRRAQAMVRGILQGRPPRSLEQRLRILDTLDAGRRARLAITAAPELGGRAFGTLWRGLESDWPRLAAIEQWERGCAGHPAVPRDFRPSCLHLDRPALKGEADQAEERLRQSMIELTSLFNTIRLEVGMAFPREGDAEPGHPLDSVPVDDLLERLQEWSGGIESLSKWIAYRLRAEGAREAGLAPLVDRLHDGRISDTHALDAFDMAFHEAKLRQFMRDHAGLAAFDGVAHERVLEEFRRLDLRRIELARHEVAFAHWERMPQGPAEIGEVGLIRRELNKRRRHLPIRQLLREAGRAITRIKPVFMMSPMSISHYVEPGVLDFDLLVIDEASQVRPVDALGAAARAKQIVVVGDDKQLPPTRFFSRSLDEIDFDDAVEQRAGDLESILGLCAACGVADRMLRWHYRSRHHSLIAVSNREFYGSRLYVIPSPFQESPELGLRFHHVADGIYDRGGSRTNRVEAQAVAQAVMQHARQHPGETLGVGAFSIHQRDAILDELEHLRREHEEVESFFSHEGPEPFFVKNLENIQGDERDVIYISVGFAADRDNLFTMNFGPLSSEGGERRLNVLITRARKRCEVYSSITDAEIDLSRASGEGPRAFKAFLAYARTGQIDIALPTGGDHQSPFEHAVAEALRREGWALDAQVGVAGFFIDLAVKDRQQPGRYLMGIECDGAAYHSARSARDRDRIRQQVLEDRGWTIHRIWSTDWFHRPHDQLKKTLAALETLQRPDAESGSAAIASAPAPASAGIERETAAPTLVEGADAYRGLSTPYREAHFDVPHETEIHEVPRGRLSRIVIRIVKVEGPVHSREVAQRVTALWDQSRTGSRVQKAVEDALHAACATGEIHGNDGFYRAADLGETPVRDRSNVRSRTLRRSSMIPPAEIQRCVEMLVENHLGVEHEEAIIATARVLGFRSTSSRLRRTIDQQIRCLLAEGRLERLGERLRVTGSGEAESGRG